jgi:hypothetical protein
MTGKWARSANMLVAITSASAVGMLVCGFLSSRGNIWERFLIALGIVLLGLMFAPLGVAATYYVKIRSDLYRMIRYRAPLADEEFIAMSPDLKGVNPSIVLRVRQSAAKQFRSIGGDRFYPGDDLETDLHLSDLTFWGEWLEGLTTNLNIEEHDLARGWESMPVRTYGDLVLLFDRLSRQSKGAKTPSELASSHPGWDSTLDGPPTARPL